MWYSFHWKKTHLYFTFFFKGEFLCPVCRRLANSVLPSLPGDFQRVWTEPKISTVTSTNAVGHLATSIEGSNLLWLQQALALLRSAANYVEKRDIWKIFPLQRNERMKQSLNSISHVLCKMYFPSRQDKFSRSKKANHYVIMWDTLTYSLKSMEIAARCGRTCMTPSYSLNGLYKELEATDGFIFSLLLKIVNSLRSKSSLHVLQRFRGIQIFAESICSGVEMDHADSAYGCGGELLPCGFYALSIRLMLFAFSRASIVLVFIGSVLFLAFKLFLG